MSKEENIYDPMLYSVEKDVYGDRYKEHVMEQYKIYIESINYTSSLKHKANSYFLTIHTLLLAMTGMSFTNVYFSAPEAWNIIAPLIGLLLSVAWWQMTRAYKKINQIKFRILHHLEKQLPFALYTAEYKIVKGEDVHMRKYHLHNMEPIVPVVFMLLYISLLLFIG